MAVAGAAPGQGPGPLLTQLAVTDAHVTLQQIVHPPGSFFLGGAGLGARRPGGECRAAQGPPGAQGCLSLPWHSVSSHRLGGGPYPLLQHGRTLCPQPQRFLPTGHSAFACGFARPCPLADHVCAPRWGVRAQAGWDPQPLAVQCLAIPRGALLGEPGVGQGVSGAPRGAGWGCSWLWGAHGCLGQHTQSKGVPMGARAGVGTPM